MKHTAIEEKCGIRKNIKQRSFDMEIRRDIYLESEGVSDDHIIEKAFDLYENIEYRDPKVFFLPLKQCISV